MSLIPQAVDSNRPQTQSRSYRKKLDPLRPIQAVRNTRDTNLLEQIPLLFPKLIVLHRNFFRSIFQIRFLIAIVPLVESACAQFRSKTIFSQHINPNEWMDG